MYLCCGLWPLPGVAAAINLSNGVNNNCMFCLTNRRHSLLQRLLHVLILTNVSRLETPKLMESTSKSGSTTRLALLVFMTVDKRSLRQNVPILVSNKAVDC